MHLRHQVERVSFIHIYTIYHMTILVFDLFYTTCIMMLSTPICSMYGIFPHIYHENSTKCRYLNIPYMDDMGKHLVYPGRHLTTTTIIMHTGYTYVRIKHLDLDSDCPGPGRFNLFLCLGGSQLSPPRLLRKFQG